MRKLKEGMRGGYVLALDVTDIPEFKDSYAGINFQEFIAKIKSIKTITAKGYAYTVYSGVDQSMGNITPANLGLVKISKWDIAGLIKDAEVYKNFYGPENPTEFVVLQERDTPVFGGMNDVGGMSNHAMYMRPLKKTEVDVYIKFPVKGGKPLILAGSGIMVFDKQVIKFVADYISMGGIKRENKMRKLKQNKKLKEAEIVTFKGFNLESDMAVELLSLLSKNPKLLKIVEKHGLELYSGGNKKNIFTSLYMEINKSRMLDFELIVLATGNAVKNEKDRKIMDEVLSNPEDKVLLLNSKILAQAIIYELIENPNSNIFSKRSKLLANAGNEFSVGRGKSKFGAMMGNNPKFREKTTKLEKYKQLSSLKESSKDSTPRIYVASLTDYNQGDLVGSWLDLTDYSSGKEVMVAISELLANWTKKS